MKKYRLKSEIIWVIGIVIPALLLLYILDNQGFKFQDGNQEISPYLKQNEAFWPVLIFGMLFSVYLIRGITASFSKVIPNVLLLIFIGLLVANIHQLNLLFSDPANGWTVYPPLSALPDDVKFDKYEPSQTEGLFKLLQYFLLGLMLVIGIKTGILIERDRKG